MRRYIRSKQLILVLHQIVDSENPHLTEVYRDIVLLRTTHDYKTYQTAAKMLACPRMTAFCILNMFLLIICGLIIHYSMPALLAPSACLALRVLISLMALLESRRLIELMRSMRESVPYLLIDELFARRILVLQKTAHGKPVKAAK